jgi:hypothetical protein
MSHITLKKGDIKKDDGSVEENEQESHLGWTKA